MADFNYSTSMFIGVTSRGSEMPVFFDTHTPIFNNNPPGILITGSPGSGKTFLALTLTTICAIIGKTTIVLDPKGDFMGLTYLKNVIGKENIKFWNLNNSKRKGILDPFYMVQDKGEQLGLVIQVIGMFIGGLSDSKLSVLAPIVKDVQESVTPSLMMVTEALLTSDRQDARDLGSQLDLISRLQFANLCFAPGSDRKDIVEIEKGITIITMIGLELTEKSDNENSGSFDSSNNKKNLSSAIFFLLTDFIRRIMNDDNSSRPKTLIIDEAWAVLSSSAGAECIKAVARLGRSKKLALILVTQNNRDIENMKIDNTITTHFAFRTDFSEAEGIIRGMRLPTNEENQSLLSNLGTGECLMKDFLGRCSTVQISNWKNDWNEAFETNPLTSLTAKKRAAKKQKVKQ